MFTGIVTDVGVIRSVEARADNLSRLTIFTRYARADIALGASIACSGVCLTVTETGEEGGDGHGYQPAEEPGAGVRAAELLVGLVRHDGVVVKAGIVLVDARHVDLLLAAGATLPTAVPRRTGLIRAGTTHWTTCYASAYGWVAIYVFLRMCRGHPKRTVDASSV